MAPSCIGFKGGKHGEGKKHAHIPLGLLVRQISHERCRGVFVDLAKVEWVHSASSYGSGNSPPRPRSAFACRAKYCHHLSSLPFIIRSRETASLVVGFVAEWLPHE